MKYNLMRFADTGFIPIEAFKESPAYDEILANWNKEFYNGKKQTMSQVVAEILVDKDATLANELFEFIFRDR